MNFSYHPLYFGVRMHDSRCILVSPFSCICADFFILLVVLSSVAAGIMGELHYVTRITKSIRSVVFQFAYWVAVPSILRAPSIPRLPGRWSSTFTGIGELLKYVRLSKRSAGDSPCRRAGFQDSYWTYFAEWFVSLPDTVFNLFYRSGQL